MTFVGVRDGAVRVIVTADDLADAHRAIPAEDFIQPSYDVAGAPLRQLLLLLSTPRSGSTFFCDVLRRDHGLVAHEYFQHDHYLPLMAERFGVIGQDGDVDAPAFVEQLIAHRTDEKGRLAINLHGSHLPLFSAWALHFPDVEIRTARLAREDIVAQAVSFEIAQQTGQWTSHFTATTEPVYSFERVWTKLQELTAQEGVIDAFLAQSGLDATRIVYEDFVTHPEEVVAAFVGDDAAPAAPRAEPNLIARQGHTVNDAWRAQFLQDWSVFEANGAR